MPSFRLSGFSDPRPSWLGNRFIYAHRCWALLVCLLSTLAARTEIPASAGEFLRMDHVWEVELELTPADWQAMEPPRPEAFRGPNPEAAATRPPPELDRPEAFRRPPGGMPPGGFEFPWVTGRVTMAGVVFTNVGVRFKGNSSFNGSRGSFKRPFKLDFDRHVPGRTFAGLEELFLNNNANDPSQLRESLAYSAFAKAGVPAPRTTGLKVWLRLGDAEPRRYLGLYTGVEAVEGDFLKRHFGTKRGLLTKPERVRGLEYLGPTWQAHEARYEPRSTVRPSEARRFVRLLRDLAESPDPTFAETVKREVDLDGLLRFVAVHAWLANYDSFLGNGHNYYLFQPSVGPLRFIAWDLNEAFGRHPMAGPAIEQAAFSVLHPAVPPNPFLQRVLDRPEWRDRYRALVRSLGEGSAPCSIPSLMADLEVLRKARSEALADEPRGGGPAGPRLGPGREGFPQGNRSQAPSGGRQGPGRIEDGPPGDRPGEGPTFRPGPRPMFDNTPVEDWIRERHQQVMAELEGTREAPIPRLPMGGPGQRPFPRPRTGGPDPIPGPGFEGFRGGPPSGPPERPREDARPSRINGAP